MKSPVAGQSLIDIDAKAFTEAAIAFGDKFDLQAGLEIEDAIRKSGQIVKRAVIKRAKRHYRTGKLERQIRTAETGADWGLTVQVRSGGKVAHLVAGNVRAHKIVSRQPETKAMPLYVRGSVIGFAEAVEHRATRGDPYFHVGAMNSRLAINAVLKASAKRLAAHLADLVTLKGRA